MNIHNLQKVNDMEVQEWFLKNIPEISPYQKEKIRDMELFRFSPFTYFKRRKSVNNMFFRLTIILFPIVALLLFISLPFGFIFTGEWGYSYEKLKWFDKWKNSIGLW